MTLDLWVGVVLLGTIFALEGVLPFYAGRRGRLAHAGRNLALAVASGAAGAAVAPLLVFAMDRAAREGFGLVRWLGLTDPGWGAAAGAVLAFVLFDLWMYAWHRANHRIPLLWRFHRVHHTDTAMDCTTALRFHPGEILLSSMANVPVVAALGMSLPTLVAYKAAMVAVILLHHSNLALPAGLDRALRAAVVTPSVHRVHHSEIRAETDSNYGTVFSVWDRLFRSFRLRDERGIRFGIGRFAEARWQGPLGLLALPLQPEPGAGAATGAAPS